MSLRSFLRVLLGSLPKHQMPKSGLQIEGLVSVETREGGKLRQRVHGKNVCTLTGREFFAEISALQAFSPRATFRDDRLAYFGLGTGAQAEVANITGLVQPVPYVTGEFLAAVQVPAVFPASSTTRTSVRLIREYGRSEVSLGSSVVLTEAGMFSDGDPASNWAVGSKPTDYATSSGDAPFFYKTFEPVTNTPDLTLRLTWEVRFV